MKFPNAVLRLVWTGQLKEKDCQHLKKVSEPKRGSVGCEECLELGDRWVHLRMCLVCGHIGCCSSSKHDHARQHFEQTGHPLIKPYDQPQMDWIWCYEDEALLSPRASGYC